MAGSDGWYVNHFCVYVIIFILCFSGLCENSENCGFILRNDTFNDSVLVRMNITAEFEVEYNQTYNTSETRVYY